MQKKMNHSYMNQCDVCDWESACFDAPDNNCTSFQNIDVRSLEDTIKSCQRAINIIKQGQKQIEQAKIEGAMEFAEWLANNRKYNPMKHDIGFAWSDEAHFSTVDEILAEWQKEKIDGTR